MQNLSTDSAPAPGYVPAMMRYDTWLRSIPCSSTTGWRWRRDNMIRTINVSGRCYITQEEIQRFLARAEAGEFAKDHVTPQPHTQAA